MKRNSIAIMLCLALLLAGCTAGGNLNHHEIPKESQGGVADLGDDSASYGDPIEDSGVYDEYFEGESLDITVKCESGTKNAYQLEGTTLSFTAIDQESVYSISGKFRGNIVIDVGDDYKFDLELCGLSLVSDSVNPITVLSGDEVSIQAKKDTENYIYDQRAAIDSTDESLHAAAIYAQTDLEIAGKGSLNVVSEHNNGIHTKDDLQVKNLTLFVTCVDNALKGNDSVQIESANTTLIATGGDGIDSNSRTSYSGIVFSGGNTVVISTSGGNSAIDCEQGYAYQGGAVVAVMPRGGMANEAISCKNFSSIGKYTTTDLSKDSYLVVGIGNVTATVKIPVMLSAYVIVLGDNAPSVSAKTEVSVSLDSNGVCWSAKQ